MTKLLPLSLLLVALFSEHCFAEMIKYTDKNGTICFVDDLSKVPKQYRKRIIRDDAEAVTVTTPSEQVQTRNTEGDRVQVCSGNSGVERGAGGDITDFLYRRGYDFHTRVVTGNTKHSKACAEMWCKLWQKDQSSACVTQAIKQIEDNVPFVVVGEMFFPTTDSSINVSIDRYFHVDPKSPYKR